jgi:abequosyltransferase
LKLSIGIPSYNRPNELKELLKSIILQNNNEIEIVISEDCSPLQSTIEEVVKKFKSKNSNFKITFSSNKINLGYDANLRLLLEKCSGDYVLFMGDDDKLLPGAIDSVLHAIENKDVAVVLRAWQSFDGKKIIGSHKYFSKDILFNAGQNTIVSFFRRSVFISGLVVRRQDAIALHTDKFDGLLLYQLYLVGMLLSKNKGYYISKIIVERKLGSDHYFGSSKIESKKFSPQELTPQHSITFVTGLFEIARYLNNFNPGLKKKIERDIGMFSYPMLEIQYLKLSKLNFLKYAIDLSKIGLYKAPMFWLYSISLFILGSNVCNFFIKSIVNLLGYTPSLRFSRNT